MQVEQGDEARGRSREDRQPFLVAQRPMLIWAALIVICIFAGFLTLYVGLVIGFPVIGHATWHAYRDLVRR